MIVFRPKQNEASAHFAQATLPRVEFTFAASDGNSSLFVSKEGDLYYSKSTGSTPEKIAGRRRKYWGCYYSFDTYYVLAEGGRELYQFTFGAEDRLVDMGLEEGETVIEIEYDHTGLLVRTNFNLFLLRATSTGIAKEIIDLVSVKVLLEEI